MMELKTFLEHWLSAWHGNKPDQLISFYAQDTFYSDPAQKNGLKGKESLHNYLKKLLGRYPDWHWHLMEYWQVDENIFVKWRANYKGKEFFGMDRVILKDRLILLNEVYFDPKYLSPES